MSVVKQFNLTQGDKLDWTFEIMDGNLVIVVRPVKIKMNKLAKE